MILYIMTLIIESKVSKQVLLIVNKRNATISWEFCKYCYMKGAALDGRE